jgi:hypothetical protein
MIPTGKEPPTVLWIHEESLSRAHIILLGDGEYFRAAVAGGGLRRPYTYFISKYYKC